MEGGVTKEKRQRDVVLLALRMEEEAIRQDMWASSRRWKSKEADSP